MKYLHKLDNIFPIYQIIREPMITPINMGRIYLYPYDGLDKLAYIINDTFNIYDKHYATNKINNIYVPRNIDIKKKNCRYLGRVQHSQIGNFIKDKCESIDTVFTSLNTVKGKNIFYDLSSHITALNKKLRYQVEASVYDALDVIADTLKDFTTHNMKYIIVSLDDKPGMITPSKIGEITPSLYKAGFNFNDYLLYAWKYNETYIRETFKDVTFIFLSKNGGFKVVVKQLPILSKETEGKTLEQILRCIRRIQNIETTPDDISKQEDRIENIKKNSADPNHIKDLLNKADGVSAVNADEVEVLKPEDKQKLLALKEKDKFENRKMTELMHKAPDIDKSTIMLEQYVRTVADNPNDTKAAIGAGIIKDIKDDIVKKSQVITTPKEKRFIDKLNAVEIRNKDKGKVLDTFHNMKLEPVKYNVETIDPTITENSFVKFNESYDKYIKDVHVKRIAKHFSTTEVPVYVQNIDIVDASDKFNYLDKYKFTFKDADGGQSTVSLKMPKFKDGKLLMNGTKFVLYNQLTQFPIVKIGEDVVITTARNKATLSYKGSKFTSVSQAKLSRSIDTIDKKALQNKIEFGDYYAMNMASGKVNIEYAYISKQILGIKTDNIDFTFKFDDSIAKYGDHTNDGYFVLGLYKGKEIRVSLDDDKVYGDPSIDGMDLNEMLVKITSEESDELSKLFISMYNEEIDPNISDLLTGLSKREIPELHNTISSQKSPITTLMQTHIKIMGRWIPLIYVLMYTDGLFSILEKAKVEYRLIYHLDIKDPDKPRSKPKIIKGKQFLLETADAWIVFNMNRIEDISLTYPLTKLDFKSYRTAQLEKRDFVATIIEEYGESINLPLYLDRFKENLIDPITADILSDHDIKSDFSSVMLYANTLLSTGKNMKDIDLNYQRLRGEESIISIMYEAMATEYEEYSAKKKRGNTKSKFTMNENAVLNILYDLPSLKPYSSLNPINEQTEAMTVMFKGHRGKNLERGYTIEKRMFDDSFYGIIGLSTSAGAGVGVNKQLVIDPKVVSPKGYLDVKGSYGAKDLNGKQLMTVVEALHPFSFNHDDPQRVAMNLSQSQQILPVADADPQRVSYGYDGMLANLSSDFAISAKDDGVILALDENVVVIQYKDKTKEIRTLKNLEKNSAKNFYTTNNLELNKGVKLGQKVKKGDIIAFNPQFFKNVHGQVIFTPGPIVWVALISEDAGYEDSNRVSRSLSKRCAKKITKHYTIELDKSVKINSYKKLNEVVSAGDELINFNKTTSDDFYNQFLEDVDSELLSLEKHAKRAGRIVELQVYYACNISEMSKSLRAFIDELDKALSKNERLINQHGSDYDRVINSKKPMQVPPNTKVNGSIVKEGKVLIEYFVESSELFGIGDKGTFNSAVKGTVAKLSEDDEMPMALTSKRRVDAILRSMSIGNRKTYSIYYNMGLNKLLMKAEDLIKDIFKDY